MKVAINAKYGPPEVIELKDLEKPIPKDNEMLVKVYASTVTSGDVTLRSGMKGKPLLLQLMGRIMMGFTKPKKTMLGSEFAGEIESTGRDMKLFKKDDQVFGTTTGQDFGTNAEYLCVRKEPVSEKKMLGNNMVAIKPAQISYAEAAAIPVGGNTALHFLKQANIQSGQKVLIYGASGSIGTFAVQLAKHFGAEVTGVDSRRKLDMLRSIGADHVIDYRREDFTKSGQRYDLILDVVVHRSIFDYKRALSPKGIVVMVGGSMTKVLLNMLIGPFISKTGTKKICIVMWKPNKKEDLVLLEELFEAGKVVPVIDRRYPLSEAAEAFRYLEKGHAQGKVVITMEHK